MGVLTLALLFTFFTFLHHVIQLHPQTSSFCRAWNVVFKEILERAREGSHLSSTTFYPIVNFILLSSTHMARSIAWSTSLGFWTINSVLTSSLGPFRKVPKAICSGTSFSGVANSIKALMYSSYRARLPNPQPLPVECPCSGRPKSPQYRLLSSSHL